MLDWGFVTRAWKRDRRRANAELHVRAFILLAAAPLLIVLVVAGVILLREMDAISTRTSTARNDYLPAILEGHRVAVASEALRRHATLVYMSDDAQTRRDARLAALALSTEMEPDHDPQLCGIMRALYAQIANIEAQRAQIDTSMRTTEDSIENLENMVRRLLEDSPLVSELRSILQEFQAVALLRDLRAEKPSTQYSLTLAGVRVLSERLIAAAGGNSDAMAQATRFSEGVKRVTDARTQTVVRMLRARLAWEDADAQLHKLRNKLNVASVDLTHSTLLSIDDHAVWMKRIIYTSFALILIVFTLLIVLLQVYIVRPIIVTSNRLQDIRTGKDSPPIGLIRIAELNEVATLINISSDQLAALYQHTRELEREKEQIRSIAITDGLTSIYNRRYFDMQYKMLCDEALFRRDPLSIAMMDIDLFKVYNDTLGHPTGDECLVRVAAAIQGAMHRKTDMVFRYGGEEFVVLLPGCTEDVALVLVERIRARVQSLGIVHPDSPVSPVVTVSIGLATLSPSMPMDCKTLLDKADAALYQAKRLGRNRVCIAPA